MGSATGFVLGIDFGGTKIALGTARPDGELLATRRLPTQPERGGEQAVARALHAARELCARTAERTGVPLAAAGVVSPGIIRPDRVLLAPNVVGWEDLALPSLAADAFGEVPLAFANDANAAALAEARWGTLQGADPALFLNLGTGVAAGLVVGGRIVAGAHGAAGELGYALRSVQDRDGVHAGRAPLEELAGGRALAQRASALLDGEWSAADVLASDDPRARELVASTFDELAVHVANAALLLDPARVAVGGGIMERADVVLPLLERRLRAAVPFPPQLVAATFVHDGALRGALALAVQAAAQRAVPTRPTEEVTP